MFMSSPTARRWRRGHGQDHLRGGAVRATDDRAARRPRQVVWPYTDFGTPGKVAEQTEVTDLDTVFVRFANGVRLTIKPTKFHDDQVLVRVRVGTGLESEDPNHQNAGWAGYAFIEGGLRQISSDDMERVLAAGGLWRRVLRHGR